MRGAHLGRSNPRTESTHSSSQFFQPARKHKVCSIAVTGGKIRKPHRSQTVCQIARSTTSRRGPLPTAGRRISAAAKESQRALPQRDRDLADRLNLFRLSCRVPLPKRFAASSFVARLTMLNYRPWRCIGTGSNYAAASEEIL